MKKVLLILIGLMVCIGARAESDEAFMSRYKVKREKYLQFCTYRAYSLSDALQGRNYGYSPQKVYGLLKPSADKYNASHDIKLNIKALINDVYFGGYSKKRFYEPSAHVNAFTLQCMKSTLGKDRERAIAINRRKAYGHYKPL